MGSAPQPKGGRHQGDPAPRRRKSYYKSEVEREGFRQGMTVEEYGVTRDP